MAAPYVRPGGRFKALAVPVRVEEHRSTEKSLQALPAFVMSGLSGSEGACPTAFEGSSCVQRGRRAHLKGPDREFQVVALILQCMLPMHTPALASLTRLADAFAETCRTAACHKTFFYPEMPQPRTKSMLMSVPLFTFGHRNPEPKPQALSGI